MSGKWFNIVIWVLTIALAVLYVLGGIAKVTMQPQMVSSFKGWGYPVWFLVLTGVLEAGGGLLLLFPRLAPWGAAVLVSVMVGAAYTHLSTGIGSPVGALILMAIAALIGAYRWRRSPDPRGA